MSGNVVYCWARPDVFNSPEPTPVVLVSGFILAPDSSLVELGSTGDFAFEDLRATFAYGDSLESVKDQVVPLIQAGYDFASLEAKVVLFPHL